MGEQWKQCQTLVLGLQNHCRWWLQPGNWKMLTPWKESYDQLRQHIKKQRHYFANNGLSSQGYGFSSSHVRIWELDLKKAEHRRIDAFELWWWRRLLRVPWTARNSNQSILKEISPECSLEGLMLKLKLWYFGHLMRRADSLEKTLMLGKIEGGWWRGQQRMGWLYGITDSVDMSLGNSSIWWWTGRPGVLQFMGSQRVGHNWATELKTIVQCPCLPPLLPLSGIVGSYLKGSLRPCRPISHAGSEFLPQYPWQLSLSLIILQE